MGQGFNALFRPVVGSYPVFPYDPIHRGLIILVRRDANCKGRMVILSGLLQGKWMRLFRVVDLFDIQNVDIDGSDFRNKRQAYI